MTKIGSEVTKHRRKNKTLNKSSPTTNDQKPTPFPSSSKNPGRAIHPFSFLQNP